MPISSMQCTCTGICCGDRCCTKKPWSAGALLGSCSGRGSCSGCRSCTLFQPHRPPGADAQVLLRSSAQGVGLQPEVLWRCTCNALASWAKRLRHAPPFSELPFCQDRFNFVLFHCTFYCFTSLLRNKEDSSLLFLCALFEIPRNLCPAGRAWTHCFYVSGVEAKHPTDAGPA